MASKVVLSIVLPFGWPYFSTNIIDIILINQSKSLSRSATISSCRNGTYDYYYYLTDPLIEFGSDCCNIIQLMNLKLLLSRPSYQSSKKLNSPTQTTQTQGVSLHSPSSQQYISVQVSPVATNRTKKFIFAPQKVSQPADMIPRLLQIQKKQRISDAYNSISDFKDKTQILQALRALKNADERIQLIDKVVERREEVDLATIKYKAKKLEPIFNVIRRKLKLQGNYQTKSIAPLQNINEEGDHPTEQQQAIMDKLSTKFASTFCFSWLTNRHGNKKPVVVDDSPDSVKRQKIRDSVLQAQKKHMEISTVITRKVTENSEEMIRQGRRKAGEISQHKYKPQELISMAQSKIDTGKRTKKRQKTLLYISNERQEIRKDEAEFTATQNKILLLRNQES